MTQSRADLIDIVGRILTNGDWDDPNVRYCDIGTKETVHQLAETIVTALRPEVANPKHSTRSEDK